MRELPPALQRYLWSVYLCATIIGVVCLNTQPVLPASFVAPGLFIFLALLTEIGIVTYSDSYRQTVATAIMVAAVFIFPPFTVVLIVTIGGAIQDITHRRPWFKTVFNAAYRTIIYGSIAQLLIQLNVDVFPLTNYYSIALVLVVFVIYLVLSTTLLGAVFSLLKGSSILSAFRDSTAILNPYDLSLFPYGLMLAWLWNANPWYFFVGLLPLASIRHAFAVHAGLLKEQAASNRLTEQQRQIHEATTSLLSSSDTQSQIDTMMKYIMDVFPITFSSVLLWGEGTENDQVMTRGTCDPPLPTHDWSDNLRRVCAARRVVRLDHEFVRQAMSGRPVLLVPLVTPDDIVGCMVLVTDPAFEVTEQNERLIETFAAQAALAIYQARLITKLKSSQVRVVQSERLAAIGTLAAGVAHEFNNLLAGISGIAQLALLENEPESSREALDTVVKSAQNGGSITRGLLTFARHLEPKREPADIRTAIDPVLSMLHAEFRRANIEVVRRFATVRPVYCDIGTLAQVMLNLVTNAIDAMYPNGGTLTIELAEEDDWIRLVVRDTGTGIPSHVRDRIFEPFVSTKTSNDGKLHGGSGLGLAISYGIIAEHDGTIEVETEEDRGTTMIIRLPLGGIATPSADREGAAVPLRMLIVDDEPLIAKSLHGMLVNDGHSAQWFTEPAKALDALAQSPVDVIFADIAMPGMDGVTLIKRAKQRVPQAMHVVVTGNADAHQLAGVAALGVSAIVEKPFSLDTIRAVVGSLRSPVSASQ